MNKRFSIILIVLLSVISSSCCHQTKKDILAVSFPEAPVEIMSNTSAGMDLINYFNILQLPQGGYRMYFSGYKADECGPDWDNQNLYYAESTDGIHYEPRGKVMDSIIEQTVFLTGDREKPFGLVGRVREDKKFAMYMWKSKDGLEFGDKTLLLNGWHDTQCFMVPRNGRFKLYTRTWDDEHRNRKNAVVEFSPEGERLSEISPLPGDFLYNSAACPVDERLDILFPTFLNNMYPGMTDTCFFKCFVVDGEYSKELACDLNKWVEPDEKWVLAAPGFINIGGDLYLAYNTRTYSHDTPRADDVVTKYKLIKAVIEYGSGKVSSQGEKAIPLPKVSIFCDHIESIARQEGIPFAEAAARIKELGYSGVDVRVLQNPEEIRILDSLGFEHACAITDINYSKGEQKDLEDLTLAFMKDRGFDRLLLVTGLMPEEGFSGEDREAERKRIAAFSARVAECGYSIMMEDYDHKRSISYNAERLDSLFSSTKDLGLVFDSGNFIFAGEDALEQLEHFRDRIGHVHLKDRTSPTDMTCVPIGTGCIPINEIIGKLVSSGYQGWLTVEQFGSRNMLTDCGVSIRKINRALIYASK